MKLSKILDEYVVQTKIKTLWMEDGLKKINEIFSIIRTHVPTDPSCQTASEQLFKILDNHGWNIEIVDGFYDDEGHTWIRVEGYIVDPTAYIFNDFPKMDADKYIETQSFDDLEDWESANGY